MYLIIETQTHRLTHTHAHIYTYMYFANDWKIVQNICKYISKNRFKFSDLLDVGRGDARLGITASEDPVDRHLNDNYNEKYDHLVHTHIQTFIYIKR